jgi:transposase
VRDLDWGAWMVFLHFDSRRFQCRRCKRVFTERLASIDQQRRQTRRFEQAIYARCCASSRNAVARATQLSWDIVDGVFTRQAQKSVGANPPGLVRVLGIDEIALKKRHKQYALVLSDVERRCVIDVLDNREKATLVAWLEALSDEQRQAIRVVSIDMWMPYRLAVNAVLPHALVVADRFHVMKQLNHRLSQLRRAIQRRLEPDARKDLKGIRWLLMRNRDTLSPENDAKLQAAIDACPALRQVYLLKEEFRSIFDKLDDPERAGRFLQAWKLKAQLTGESHLIKFANTLDNWWDEILAYFNERITNGFVEGTNRAIRTIISRAYGYRNFGNFRLQVLSELGSDGIYPR